MLERIREKYTLEGIMQYFMNAGSGYPGSHTVADSSNGYTAATGEYCYAIEMYTDAAKFTALSEDSAVASIRLDAGGDGYPAGTVITGKFTSITPAAGTVVGLFIKR